MMKNVKLGAMLGCLLVFLTGCATTSPPVVKTETRMVPVPVGFTKPTPAPDISKATTNQDLAEAALSSYPAALKMCNDDKRRIREFSDREVSRGTGSDQ